MSDFAPLLLYLASVNGVIVLDDHKAVRVLDLIIVKLIAQHLIVLDRI